VDLNSVEKGLLRKIAYAVGLSLQNFHAYKEGFSTCIFIFNLHGSLIKKLYKFI